MRSKREASGVFFGKLLRFRRHYEDKEHMEHLNGSNTFSLVRFANPGFWPVRPLPRPVPRTHFAAVSIRVI